MAPGIEIVPVTDAVGAVIEPVWLDRAEPVHRQLRPGLPSAYGERLRQIFANGGRFAVVAEGAEVVADDEDEVEADEEIAADED